MVHVRYPSLWAPGQDSITMVCAQWWAVEKRCATQGWLCVYVPSPQTLPMAKGIEPLDGSWGLWALWAPWHTSQAFPSQGITWGVTFSFYLLGQGIQTGFCQVCNNENKQTKKIQLSLLQDTAFQNSIWDVMCNIKIHRCLHFHWDGFDVDWNISEQNGLGLQFFYSPDQNGLWFHFLCALIINSWQRINKLFSTLQYSQDIFHLRWFADTGFGRCVILCFPLYYLS